MRLYIEKLLSIKNVVPHSCAFCGQYPQRARVCKNCIDVLPWMHTFCERCGQSLPTQLPVGTMCASCQKTPPYFVKARAPFRYAFPIDTALKAMKFRRQLIYAPAFASLLLQSVETEFSQCDALIAVPLHRWRQAMRGFNQATELSFELAKLTNLPMISNVVRVRPTQSQSGLTSAMRKRNLHRAFAVKGRLTVCRPLIIDDVITTGTTCAQLALAILEAGAETVSVLTVARASQSR